MCMSTPIDPPLNEAQRQLLAAALVLLIERSRYERRRHIVDLAAQLGVVEELDKQVDVLLYMQHRGALN